MAYSIAYYGTVDEMDNLLVLIYKHRIKELEEALNNEVDIDRYFLIGEYSKISMIELAASINDIEIVKLLIKKGALITKRSLELAVRYGDVGLLNVLKEDLVKLSDTEKKDLFVQAYYGQKAENVSALEELGITVRLYGAISFKHAVFDTSNGRNDEERHAAWCFVEELLRLNVDINDNSADMVFADGSTPLMIAVETKNYEMAKKLVETGADISICNSYKERPYIIALRDGEKEFAEVLYQMESHCESERKEKEKRLETYGMPESMIAYLKDEHRIFTKEVENCSLNTIEFLPFEELIEMEYRKKKYLRISLTTNDYWFFICFRPEDGMMVCLDPEHQSAIRLGSWDAFIEDPIRMICRKMFKMKV